MPLFLFPHDLDSSFDPAEVKRAVEDLSAIEAQPGIGATLEWAAAPHLACELSADCDAIWADGDEAPAFEYLVRLAGKFGTEIDMSDHDFTFHVHVHDHLDFESCMREAENQRRAIVE